MLRRPSPESAPQALPGLSKPVSVSLDLIRCLAACAVVLCHFGTRRISGGLLWQLNPYGAQAVDVFFVLSGYVISYAATLENARPFVANRAARIYSVAIAAAVLTFFADAAGRHWSPGLYADLPAFAPRHASPLMQAAGGLLFFNQAWFLDIPVGANIPWWSLGYEVPYYLAFGLACYARGAWRVAGPVLVALLAGPNIVALSPLWLAGAAVFALHRTGWPRPPIGQVLALAAPLLWLIYEALAWRYGRPFGLIPRLRPELVQDWLIGALFTAFLAGLPSLVSRLTVPRRAAAAIRFMAGRSFTLYLVHFPLLLCLHAALRRFAPEVSPLWLLPTMLFIVLAVAEVTERRKGAWRRLFSSRMLPSA
jgi:peptidoglycan/LPS O-acetylase OafA/YrhL